MKRENETADNYVKTDEKITRGVYIRLVTI